jgi:hypothetical protein
MVLLYGFQKKAQKTPESGLPHQGQRAREQRADGEADDAPKRDPARPPDGQTSSLRF